MRNILLPSLAVALTLSGCGIYSKYEAKDEVPDGLFGQVDSLQSQQGGDLASLPWREVFTDPQLQNLISQVLENNIDLQVA